MARDIGRRLRVDVARRADFRCEYCLIHEDDAGFPHQIDHIVSRKHGGGSEFGNLAYACIVCNRHKGSDIASIHQETDSPVRLFNPRSDRWSNHFRLNGHLIEPLTPIGVATVRLLRMNAAGRVAERRVLQLLGRYAED